MEQFYFRDVSTTIDCRVTKRCLCDPAVPRGMSNSGFLFSIFTTDQKREIKKKLEECDKMHFLFQLIGLCFLLFATIPAQTVLHKTHMYVCVCVCKDKQSTTEVNNIARRPTRNGANPSLQCICEQSPKPQHKTTNDGYANKA